MSLTRPDPPAETLRAFTSGLTDFVDSSDPVWSVALNKYVALDAHNLDLDTICGILHDNGSAETISSGTVEAFEALAANQPVTGGLLRSSGWRFLAADGDVACACHVRGMSPGLPPKLTGYSKGAPVLAVIEAFNGLDEALASASITGNFQMRVLRITWLHLEAFWLHSLDGDQDWVVPYAGFLRTPGGSLALMEPITSIDFFEEVLPRIQDACARSSAHQSAVQDATLKRAQANAHQQKARIERLQDQAKKEEEKARSAFRAAAIAQVRADVNRATAKQIEAALEVTRADAEAIVEHRTQHKGYPSWESFKKGLAKLKPADRTKLGKKEHLVGYGPKRAPQV